MEQLKSKKDKRNVKRVAVKEKSRLHSRNKNRERYDFDALIKACPELNQHVKLNKFKDRSIDFSNSSAVTVLNKAILKYHYNISYWDIPKGYLCPPIPGRADYIHHIADLLCKNNYGKIPQGKDITCLDVGVGANCIYPILGNHEYGWSFIGADIDAVAIESAQNIVDNNSGLADVINCRKQENPKDIFYGVLRKNEKVDLTICNPPFHSSAEEAEAGTLRKLSNLNQKKISDVSLNFGGKSNELWCKGGEKQFVCRMIRESKKFRSNCFWFSTLISKQPNLKTVYEVLKQVNSTKIETIPMGQGNKTSRIVAWTFLDAEEQKQWRNLRWK